MRKPRKIESYHHATPFPPLHDGCDCAGNPPGTTYFTSVKDVDVSRYLALTGPYLTHVEALERLPLDRDRAYELDPKAPWYAYGTFAAKPGAVVHPAFPTCERCKTFVPKDNRGPLCSTCARQEASA